MNPLVVQTALNRGPDLPTPGCQFNSPDLDFYLQVGATKRYLQKTAATESFSPQAVSD